jgi:Zn-dependent M28 family amino/carboxypeptidase
MKRLVSPMIVLFAFLSFVLAPFSVAAQSRSDADKLLAAVTTSDMLRTLRQFQEVAERNGTTRASGTRGYDLSADYVARLLQQRGYTVMRQEFEFEFYDELVEVGRQGNLDLAPEALNYTRSTPVGGITAPIVPVPEDATPGCETSDFAGANYAGAIALVKRGACSSGPNSFIQKSNNAAAAGAIAIIIYNNATDPEEPFDGTLAAPGTVNIPTVGIARGIGETLAAQPGVVTLDIRVLIETRTTENVIADSPFGRADNVVMVGAHLDSVLKGPGINDNGSGTAAILEIAVDLTKTQFTNPLRNKVRFAFWGAEESNLLGSRYYVNSLTFEQQLNIALYLNFDMVASPNYGRFVYDGDDSDGVGAGPGPFGSAQIEDVFETFFASRGQASEGTDFSGRSDYGPFIDVGIPAGGLFTGAEGIKTAEQVVKYGGVAGLPYDICYHEACDTWNEAISEQNPQYGQLEAAYGDSTLVGNVNVKALDEMSDAAAYATLYFIQTALIP